MARIGLGGLWHKAQTERATGGGGDGGGGCSGGGFGGVGDELRKGG